MGCWGITAFESDTGLDAVGLIRENLPDDGKADIKKMLHILKKDSWSRPPDITEGQCHSSPMALAEIIVRLVDGQEAGLDHEGNEKKFSALTSFSADKESLRWLRDYLADTLAYKRKEAAAQRGYPEKWGGWFKEQNWIDWQKHMERLTMRLEELLVEPERVIELIGAGVRKTSMEIQGDVPVLRM